jgi:hypothetical protein
MIHTLLDAVRRHAEAHADVNGIAQTPVPGLTLIRQTAPTELQYAINRPLVAMVLQGSKRVTMGSSTFDFGAGESLLIAADVPTVSQITRANISVPYFSLVVDLDPAVIESLVVDMGSVPFDAGTPVRVDPTEAEVADSALRLMRLQFQKQLRLIEARRMMLADGEMISNAAYAVGYESVTQFTREYGRMFGLPPARDMKATRTRMQPSPELAASAVN